MAELKGWVLAKLLWNPTRDGQELINEFIDGYYGPAGKHIRAYLELIHDEVDRTQDRLGCFSPETAGFLSFDTMRKGLVHLQAAEAEAGSDATLRQRVRVAQLPVLYTFLLRWDQFRNDARRGNLDWPVPTTSTALYDQFMEVAKAANMTRVAEGALDWLQTIRDRPERKHD